MKSQTPDLILMDIRMPVMDGVEATKKIKQNPALSKIPVVVVLTASATQKEREKIEALSIFDAYIIKPIIDLDEFINKVESLLRRKGNG
ncbi:MAG: response regulator [Thermodesulfovibrionales bacterium]